VSAAPEPPDSRWIATCARGLEEILEGELRRHGFAVRESGPGGVIFAGDLTAGIRANWRLTTANRILLEVASWPAPDDAALYDGARRLVTAGGPGSRWLGPERTFAVLATTSRSALRDTRWIALKVKDGIVDGQRERYGRRASIDRERPDLSLRLRLHGDRATLLVDTSGEPLDRRGYRLESTAAPLREQLAAAALLATGWDGRGPVVDPMCGSGTFLAEAGAIALGLAPNRLRDDWAFARLPGFDPRRFAEIRAEPLAAPDPAVRLFGYDLDPRAVAAARRNLTAAGLAAHCRIERGDAFEVEPPEGPGLIAVNPPYGERLAQTADQWRRLGDLLKSRYRGWRAAIVAGDEDLGRHLGLRPARRIPIRNGPLEARILVVELW
jgi:23S rRNA (guanine2445-N2)-methyltransferase